MTTLENLLAAKASVSANLASILTNPKPSYSLDGQSVSWTEYYKNLADQIEGLNKLIQAEQPYQIHSQFM